MNMFLKVVLIVQVISALAMWPYWNSPEYSIANVTIGGIWILANLPGIVLAIILAMLAGIVASYSSVQADAFDGFLGYLFFIWGPTVLSVIFTFGALWMFWICNRGMNGDINKEEGEQ